MAILFLYFCLFRAAPAACGSSQARGQIRAAASGLHHSYSKATPQPTATQGQGLNPNPHGYWSGLLPLSHSGNSGDGIFFFFFFFFLLFAFQGHTCGIWRFPGQGVKLNLQPLAYTIATTTQDLTHVCGLHHSSPQCQILNPLSEARNRTRNLMVPSQILSRYVTIGTPKTISNGNFLNISLRCWLLSYVVTELVPSSSSAPNQ